MALFERDLDMHTNLNRSKLLITTALILFLSFFTSTEPRAAASTKLTVYTSRKEHLIEEIFKQYTQNTGVKIKYKTGTPGALVQSIIAEGSKSPADIYMTVDAGNLWFAASEDVLEKTSSHVLKNNIPENVRDKNDRWFGLSIRARTIVYNTEKVKPQDLSTYEDLASPKWKGRLCLRTGKKVYNQSLVAMLIYELGKAKAREIVRGWVANTAKIHSNDTSVLKAVVAGECDLGIVNTYYFGRLQKKNENIPLALFWPNQGNSYGAHINISGAGIVKTSKNKAAAKKFLEWLSSEDAQSSYAQINMEYPVLRSATNAPQVDAWGKFKPNNSFPLYKAGELQKEAMLLMQEVKYR